MSETAATKTTASRITTVGRVYPIIALFVAQILCLVLLFQFQIDSLTAIRAYVGGEGEWAKAQKDAVRSLEHYAISHDEADYLAYRRQIQVTVGDRRARIELQKENPDIAVVRAGFVQGRNHPDDLESMIRFFRRSQHIGYMARVIGHWTAGDSMITELNEVAEAVHEEIATGPNNSEAVRSSLIRLDDITRQVTVEENLFSSTLAEASRWGNDFTRNLTYAIALLFLALGIGLSWQIVIRMRRTENALFEARDELVRKEKLAMLGQVAGSVGHELRNPLGVMSNAVYFLQTVLMEGDDSVKEYLGIIRDEISRSEHIVGELLAAVRTRSPNVAPHAVAELVGQVLRKCVVPDAVTVTLDIPETIPPLRVDALQMQQALGNLISNGVEAMPEGGALTIRAYENRQDSTVCLSVRDSGSGMTPEVMANLFQPLFTTKARGIGLGLVVVKNLTQANGGSIGVESVPGNGSRFFVTLPSEADDRIVTVHEIVGKES